MARDRRALVINAEVQDAIKAAVERARAHPVPLDVTMKLALSAGQVGGSLRLSDRRPDMPERPSTECLEIFDGYQCAFSFEQQPAGIVRHLSIAVNNPGKVPMPAAVEMISKEYGFTSFPPLHGQVWVEEFRPGEWAVNVAELTEEPKQPTRQ